MPSGQVAPRWVSLLLAFTFLTSANAQAQSPKSLPPPRSSSSAIAFFVVNVIDNDGGSLGYVTQFEVTAARGRDRVTVQLPVSGTFADFFRKHVGRLSEGSVTAKPNIEPGLYHIRRIILGGTHFFETVDGFPVGVQVSSASTTFVTYSIQLIERAELHSGDRGPAVQIRYIVANTIPRTSPLAEFLVKTYDFGEWRPLLERAIVDQ